MYILMSLSSFLAARSASSLVLSMKTLTLLRHVGGLVIVFMVSMSLFWSLAESKMSYRGEVCLHSLLPMACFAMSCNGCSFGSVAMQRADLWQMSLIYDLSRIMLACMKSKSDGVVLSAPVASRAAFLWTV